MDDLTTIAGNLYSSNDRLGVGRLLFEDFFYLNSDFYGRERLDYFLQNIAGAFIEGYLSAPEKIRSPLDENALRQDVDSALQENSFSEHWW